MALIDLLGVLIINWHDRVVLLPYHCRCFISCACLWTERHW